MLICEKCGGRLKVTNTYNQDKKNEIVRRLKCLKCGAVCASIEGIYNVSDILKGGGDIGDGNNGNGTGENEAS